MSFIKEKSSPLLPFRWEQLYELWLDIINLCLPFNFDYDMIFLNLQQKWRFVLKKKELIFIAGILILAGVLWLGFQIAGKRSHNTIRITVDGKEFGTYSLSQDQIIHIGDTNVCEIKDGKVTMIEATCPDHYCIKQNAVDEHGGSIICLPNKVVIEGENTAEDSDSDSSPKIDAVT